jgi:hypothetical protein
VQGIEAVIRGDLDVKSLQEWNRELVALRAEAGQGSAGQGSAGQVGAGQAGVGQVG